RFANAIRRKARVDVLKALPLRSEWRAMKRSPVARPLLSIACRAKKIASSTTLDGQPESPLQTGECIAENHPNACSEKNSQKKKRGGPGMSMRTSKEQTGLGAAWQAGPYPPVHHVAAGTRKRRKKSATPGRTKAGRSPG